LPASAQHVCDAHHAIRIPPGYEEAFVYNLARRMAKPWGAVLDDETKNLANQTLTTIKRGNLKLVTLRTM